MEFQEARSSFNLTGMALFTFATLSIVAQLVLLSLFQLPAVSELFPQDPMLQFWILTTVPLYVVAFPAAWLVFRRVPPAVSRNTTRIGAKDMVALLVMCFPIMYFGNIIGTLLSAFLSDGNAVNTLTEVFTDNSPLQFVVVVLLAPILEEFIFRKLLINRTVLYGEKTAIIFSALAFALFHMNLFQFFYAFGLGLLMAYAYVRTGRLRYPIAMHMTVNFVGSQLSLWVLSALDMELLTELQSALLAENHDAIPAILSEILPGMLVYLLYVFLLLGLSITGLVLLILKRKSFQILTTPEQLPAQQVFSVVCCNWGVGLYTAVCILMIIYALFA